MKTNTFRVFTSIICVLLTLIAAVPAFGEVSQEELDGFEDQCRKMSDEELESMQDAYEKYLKIIKEEIRKREKKNQKTEEPAITPTPAATTEPADSTEANYGSATFSDFYVKIVSASAEVVNNQKYIIIGLEWTNLGSEADCYSTKTSAKVFQNGIEVEKGSQYTSGLDIETNEFTYVLPGYSLVVYEIYKLNDWSDVVYTATELMDFSNKYGALVKKFTFNAD